MDPFLTNEFSIVTVIIPTFRRPHLLKRAINSVLAQTYPHFQICVYDNASGDKTPEVVAEFMACDKRVTYHVHSENIGSNRNWQYGFDQVNTPFFTVLSDDDLFMPTFLEEAMKGFAHHPDAGVFIGGLIVIDEKRRVKTYDLYEWADRQYFAPREFIAELAQGRPLPFWSAMIFRKEVRDQIGRLKVELLWHDVEFLFRMFKKFPVILSHVPCSIFLVHSSSISLGLSMDEFAELRNHLYTMFDDLFSQEEKNILGHKLKEANQHNILGFCFQKMARGCFDECLRGIELLIKSGYHLSIKGKVFFFLSKKCWNNRILVYIFNTLINFRRIAMRAVRKRRLKSKISSEEFRNFRHLINK